MATKKAACPKETNPEKPRIKFNPTAASPSIEIFVANVIK